MTFPERLLRSKTTLKPSIYNLIHYLFIVLLVYHSTVEFSTNLDRSVSGRLVPAAVEQTGHTGSHHQAGSEPEIFQQGQSVTCQCIHTGQTALERDTQTAHIYLSVYTHRTDSTGTGHTRKFKKNIYTMRAEEGVRYWTYHHNESRPGRKVFCVDCSQ